MICTGVGRSAHVTGSWCLNLVSGRVKTWSLRMCSAGPDYDGQYTRAVAALNGLQTNAAVLEVVRQKHSSERRSQELLRMHEFLGRVGLQAQDLDRLNVIHVTGTKGKGSVCAMCERILRAHGLTTGFYSSPHLREVRERIRLNGRPLSKAMFVDNFWEVFNKLDSSKVEYSDSMPNYFRFLTVMAFNTFLKEKVDVAVVEVGIGGTFDSTNIIPNPVVCGIASLGYDHVDILGDTLEKIAWQKGGICKRGHPAFTLTQEPSPLRALQERAEELKASSFEVAPDLKDYPGEEPVLNLTGKYQKANASLAIQLSKSWLHSTGNLPMENNGFSPPSSNKQLLHGVPLAETFPLSPQIYEGLRDCKWPGRNQVIKEDGVSFYMDGAHTPQSVEASAEWFVEASKEEAKVIGGSVVRVLLFNTTRNRQPDIFLRPFLDCEFDYAIFAPNITDVDQLNSADQTNMTVTVGQQCKRPIINEKVWSELILGGHSNGAVEKFSVSKHSPKLTEPIKLGESHISSHVTDHVSCSEKVHDPQTRVFSCLRHAYQWCTLNQGVSSVQPHPWLHPLPHKLMEANHVQVLVTGSLHLVGTFMNVLDYNIDE